MIRRSWQAPIICGTISGMGGLLVPFDKGTATHHTAALLWVEAQGRQACSALASRPSMIGISEALCVAGISALEVGSQHMYAVWSAIVSASTYHFVTFFLATDAPRLAVIPGFPVRLVLFTCSLAAWGKPSNMTSKCRHCDCDL